MSYMNDDTDPFGVSYSNTTTSNNSKVSEKEEQVIEYNLTEYTELLNQKEDYKQTLEYLNDEIDVAKVQIEDKIKRICEGVITNIEFESHRINVTIHMTSLTSLLQLKKELSLKDIEIRNNNNNFKLYLMW